MSQFSIEENGRAMRTVASKSGAALEWKDNQALRVYEMSPTGPVGPDCWQKSREVLPDELRKTLRC